MLSTTNIAQQTDADRILIAKREADAAAEVEAVTPVEDDILGDTTVDLGDLDFGNMPVDDDTTIDIDPVDPAAPIDPIDPAAPIEPVDPAAPVEPEGVVEDVAPDATPVDPATDISFEDTLKNGDEAAVLAWAQANPYTPQARAVMKRYDEFNFRGSNGTLDQGFKYEGSYEDAMNLMHWNANEFHNGSRDTDEFRNSTDVISSRGFVDTYMADIGSEGDTNTTDFFNIVNNMYVHNPAGYAKWAAETPEMAIRFHAMAATDSFHAPLDQKGQTVDHQGIADRIGQGLRLEAGWGDEQKRDGQVWATNYGGEVSKDVNNPMSGGDFWKIGTPQKVTDGIGNYIKDNPVKAIAIVGSIAFAGPLATWASAAAGGGMAGAVAGGAAAGALTGGVTSFVQDGDFGDILEGALMGGLTGAVTGGISEYISPAQMGPAFEGIPDFHDPSFGIEDAYKFADAAEMPVSWVDQIKDGISVGDDFSWGEAIATVTDAVTDMSALIPDGAISSSENGMGAGMAGLGSASILAGNGTGAGQDNGLFDLTKISPAAYAILGPMIDNTEGLMT